MSLEILKDWTPFGLVTMAVGYLFMSRPTRAEVMPRLDDINNRLEWQNDTLFKMAAKTPGVEVKPPPEKEQ